jgi:hypothetical protein
MKSSATLLVSMLAFAMIFISCDDNDYPIPIKIPVATSDTQPPATIIDVVWFYDKTSKTIDGVTSPEVFFDNSQCGSFNNIKISESGNIKTEIYYFYASDDYINNNNGFDNGCVGAPTNETWSLLEGKYRIPIVATYRVNDGKIEMKTDIFDVVSVSSTVLKLKSYPKIEEGKTTVINITFINNNEWGY